MDEPTAEMWPAQPTAALERRLEPTLPALLLVVPGLLLFFVSPTAAALGGLLVLLACRVGLCWHCSRCHARVPNDRVRWCPICGALFEAKRRGTLMHRLRRDEG